MKERVQYSALLDRCSFGYSNPTSWNSEATRQQQCEKIRLIDLLMSLSTGPPPNRPLPPTPVEDESGNTLVMRRVSVPSHDQCSIFQDYNFFSLFSIWSIFRIVFFVILYTPWH